MSYHVENNPGLAWLIEVQSVPRHDIEQVLDSQRAQLIALEMIRCHQMPLLTARKQVLTRRAVIRSVRQELQGEERVGGAALTQVQLDGVRRPVAGGISLYHEVKCEPTQCALLSQPLTYGDRRFTDQS